MLIDAGAKLELVTNGACHTALHCAAMGDAPSKKGGGGVAGVWKRDEGKNTMGTYRLGRLWR